MNTVLIEREFLYPLKIPAPSMLRWAHLKILKDGCLYCGSQALEFIKGEMGPLYPKTTIAKWEDIIYQCKECQTLFTYRFLSPKVPKMTYERMARSHIRELVSFFAKNMTDEDNTENYLEFGSWLSASLNAAILESKLKNIPLAKWLLDEIISMSTQLNKNIRKVPSDEAKSRYAKQPKLLMFAMMQILPTKDS